VTVTEADEAETPELPPLDGEIGIEWPRATFGAGWAVPGWRLSPFNTDGPINTISRITLHADALSIVWAEVTMFVGEDGRPLYRSDRIQRLRLDDDGKPVTGTFRFLVTEMRVAQPQEIKPLKYAKRGTASNLTPVSRPAASGPPQSTP